jgi:hypothetical protein
MAGIDVVEPDELLTPPRSWARLIADPADVVGQCPVAGVEVVGESEDPAVVAVDPSDELCIVRCTPTPATISAAWCSIAWSDHSVTVRPSPSTVWRSSTSFLRP